MNTSPETTLFTALLTDPNAYLDVAAVLRAEDFHSADDRALFRAIVALGELGKPLDVSHVYEQLRLDGMADSPAEELIERATDGSAMPGVAKHYAIMVRESSRRRRIGSAMELIRTRAEAGENPEELIRDALQSIWDLQDDKPEDTVLPVKRVMPGLMDETAELRAGSQTGDGIATSIFGLDQATRGICPSEFWVVGALPGRGKTAFATQAAVTAVKAGIPTLFVSLEMTRQQLVRRILAMTFGAAALRNPRSMTEEKWTELTEHAGEICGWPLYIDDSSTLSAAEVSVRARATIKHHGVKLVIVDYLQLLKGTGRELRERVGNAANVLRQLAKDTGVPVMALSQLRRPGDLNARPTMIDLKESGDIEAHANTVLLLYMPLNDDDQPTGEDEIIIGKQRNGPLGSVDVAFDRRTLLFRERERVLRD